MRKAWCKTTRMQQQSASYLHYCNPSFSSVGYISSNRALFDCLTHLLFWLPLEPERRKDCALFWSHVGPLFFAHIEPKKQPQRLSQHLSKNMEQLATRDTPMGCLGLILGCPWAVLDFPWDLLSLTGALLGLPGAILGLPRALPGLSADENIPNKTKIIAFPEPFHDAIPGSVCMMRIEFVLSSRHLC